MKQHYIESTLKYAGNNEIIKAIPVSHCSDIVNETEMITELTDIKITFDYPLGKPVTFEFHSDNGFNKQRFWEAVYLGYTKIYSEDSCVKGRAKRCADYPDVVLKSHQETNGPYGIWGHDMGDLVIEGIEEKTSGNFRLHIGS